MSARDIDLNYADDGRTLQGARLMEQSVLELPAAGAPGARRIAGQTIDVGLAPDGTTVTGLGASGGVQVDLPGDQRSTTKQIRSSTLAATGAAGQGVQQLTFEGPVEFRESRAAARGSTALDRTARAMRLVVDTKPGFGTIDRADFRGNVSITDGADVTAGAPRALYHLATEEMELSPSGSERGPAPFVNDSRVQVEARNIRFSPASRRLVADTDVRSTIQARRQAQAKPRAGQAAPAREARLPSMLSPDQPVTVTANRLEYDGQSVATYDGNARLWQDKSKVYADSIVIDDRTGNLTARGHTRTTMILDDVDPKTKERSPTETNATADLLVYNDEKRLATYTAGPSGRAHIVGAQGDLTADRTELYLREGGKELERAVSDGSVVVKESGRTATGQHLVYTASTDTYVMTGKPVEIIEKEATGCKQTVGAKLTFNRSNAGVRMENDGLQLVDAKSIPCPAEQRD
jgi:lipopolysaccharide export system protein LptA